MPIYCSECGAPNVDNAKFCRKCGKAILDLNAPPAPEAPVSGKPAQPEQIFQAPPAPKAPESSAAYAPPITPFPPPTSAAPSAAYTPPPPPPQQQPPAAPSTQAAPTKSASSDTLGLSSNIGGLLAYVAWWASGVVLFVLEKKDNFIRFHAAQSIVTFGALNVAIFILALFSLIPFAPIRILFMTLYILLWVASAALWIFMMYKAYKGSMLRLPFAGDLVKRIFKL